MIKTWLLFSKFMVKNALKIAQESCLCKCEFLYLELLSAYYWLVEI